MRGNKIKGALTLNTRCQSVSNLLSHTLPQLDDTQNKHVEGIYDSCIDKVIMCIKRKERGGGERVDEKEGTKGGDVMYKLQLVCLCVCVRHFGLQFSGHLRRLLV